MPLSRRHVILAAGGAGLALVGSGGLFAVTRSPTAALAPWDDAQAPPPPDVRLDAFRHAVLAPNPHNRQPWLIRLEGRDAATVLCDLDRRLPETDPFDRQIVIGFGCFLELARMAAAERGVALEIEPFPEGEPAPRLDARPVARLRFRLDPAVERDPLFRHVLTRRSTKRPFDTGRPVPEGSLENLARAVGPFAGLRVTGGGEGGLVRDLRDLTLRAWVIESETPRTFQESVDLMRIGRSEIEANPDGVSLGGPVIEALALAGQISRPQLADPGSAAFKSGLSLYREMLSSAMAYTWITTDVNTRAAQVAAGRAYVRLNLAATAAGLALHPVSQALQEFPEMAETRRAVNARIGVPERATLQMLARIGYGPTTARTPRWRLETRMLPAA